MDSQEFKVRGRQMVDYIIQYLEEIETRRVTPAIEPGYLSDLIPASPPHDPEPWEDVMKDVEEKIMVGMTHWQHPRFHAYFPAGNSFPSILADMLSGAIGCVGFSWVILNIIFRQAECAISLNLRQPLHPAPNWRPSFWIGLGR